MKTLVGIDALTAPAEGSAVTIGTFDGVHIGHRALIAKTIGTAHELGAEAVAVTWDRHPNETLRPERVPPLLTTPERKVELLATTGLDALVVLPFDEELSHWPPQRFATDVLAKGLGARAVLVGEGWRFGHKAAGDVALLRALGQTLGFDARGVALAVSDGVPVSSSLVREAVTQGALSKAAALLGRPFDLDGVVVRGDDRGAALGFPTANIDVDEKLAHPPRGVYACRARADDSWYPAAVNLGVNPTFGGDPETSPPKVEAYLLDFEGDLYGRTLRIEFRLRLRDEEKFPSAEALIGQMTRDVATTRDVLGS